MKKIVYSLLLLASSSGAYAATYYVSDCGSGSTSQCVPGSDANLGTSASAPWQTCAKVTAQFPKLAAGDQVLFARGSAQNACKLYYLSNLNSRKDNPITLGAYTPAWATAQTANPILNGLASNYGLNFMNSGNSSHDEGYVVQDLHFVGAGPTSTVPAIMMSNDVDYVTIRRVEIEQFRGGIQCDGGTTQPQNAGSDGISEHMIIRDSKIHHTRGMGILTACNDSLIENNDFDSNGVGMLDHHIYVDDAAVNKIALWTSQIVIRGNRMINNTPYASTSSATPTPGGCASAAIVIHGLKNGLVIENNLVSEPTTPKNSQCWGIIADTGDYSGIYQNEAFTNFVIRGNTVVNYAMGIGLGMCDTCTIENNYVYSEFAAGAVGIAAPAIYFRPLGVGKAPNDKLTVRNNSVYLKAPTYASVGIRIGREGTKHTVASNLVYFAAGTTATTACFNTTGFAVTAFSAFDHNLCHFSGSQGMWDNSRTTLATQQASGLDLHSLTANPSLSTPVAPSYALTLTSGSPALNVGHPTLSSRFGKGGVKRDATPDIGAFESGATTVVPSSPTRIGLQ